jgi:uncharacterized protein with von Willebrand factor type A (vWA) domain
MKKILNSKMKTKEPDAWGAKDITEAVVGFSQLLREHGMNAGMEETITALRAAGLGLLTPQSDFRSCLKVIFCTSPEEGKLFEILFARYWEGKEQDRDQQKNQAVLAGRVTRKASAVLMGQGKTDPDDLESRTTSGANESERLRETDFSRVKDMDATVLHEIAEKLFQQMAMRLRRRLKNARRRGEINLRRTIRRSIEFGGEPMELLRRFRRKKKQRVLVFLDVSGSMDKYSFYLLRFIRSLQEKFRQMEVFVFSTTLIRITGAVGLRNLEEVLHVLSHEVDNWSGGTRIGESLQIFQETYGKRMLNGSPTVIILSDGLETGDTQALDREMQWLKKRTGTLVWLNPLKGMEGYEPLAGGMKAALSSIDEFRSAHNLNSLLELENFLAHV